MSSSTLLFPAKLFSNTGHKSLYHNAPNHGLFQQDQPHAGAVASGDRQLGRTMVLYPGYPLVGRIVTVVRRYGQRERGQWIIELPDGSRQYVPIAWCAPLSSSEETLLLRGVWPHGDAISGQL